ncbi:hypothetical protein AVEN_131480-1 [Araneus ventricosus]|uniref:Uncharacterized protein n=1 Tax=Araneus ventricosus TaxID=182803 RepID=A0A4Y2JDV3_ARAVE|nr:hypothetical protein AVEN_131480-1 [Araneus ventricosus]
MTRGHLNRQLSYPLPAFAFWVLEERSLRQLGYCGRSINGHHRPRPEGALKFRTFTPHQLEDLRLTTDLRAITPYARRILSEIGTNSKADDSLKKVGEHRNNLEGSGSGLGLLD